MVAITWASESAGQVAEQKAAEGKAIGGACRHANRALEDCYRYNPKANKAAVFDGWKDMDVYMRENKLETIAPVTPPEPPKKPTPPPKKDDEEAAADTKDEKKTTPRRIKKAVIDRLGKASRRGARFRRGLHQTCPLEHGNALHVCRVRKHVDDTRARTAVACAVDQQARIARQSGGVAADVHNALGGLANQLAGSHRQQVVLACRLQRSVRAQWPSRPDANAAGGYRPMPSDSANAPSRGGSNQPFVRPPHRPAA